LAVRRARAVWAAWYAVFDVNTDLG
jgi:hypothetical protein